MTEARELGVIACHPRVCTRALLTRLRVIPTCRLIFQEVGTIVSEPNTQLPNAPAV